jgi:hypothetical protein
VPKGKLTMDNAMLGRLIRLVVTIPSEMLGVLCDLLEKLASSRGGEWFERLKLFLRNELSQLKQAAVVYFRRLYGDEVIKVGEEIFSVYEMVKNGNFAELFGSLGYDLNKLAFTSREKVDEFCHLHRDKLSQSRYATFFLFKGENGQFSVADVRIVDDRRLDVDVLPFDFETVLNAFYQHRIVVPQQ